MTAPAQGRFPARVVGAYAAQPADPASRQDFVRAVLALPSVTGLEITFGAAVYREDETWLWRLLPQGGRHVITLVGATMEALGRDPRFGLASEDDEGRGAALSLLRAARQAVAVATDDGQRIVAVEVQSAPSPKSGEQGSARRLRDSIVEAAQWDWRGAALVVEHCDAPGRRPSFAKGFLGLDEELAVLTELEAEGLPTPVGLAVNWGRSAIEAEGAHGVETHIDQAHRSGLLRGLIFSGASGTDSVYGPAWHDSHVPAAALDASVGEPTSLLTSSRIERAAALAGDRLLYDGVKVSVRPKDASVVRRVAHVAAVLAAMP